MRRTWIAAIAALFLAASAAHAGGNSCNPLPGNEAVYALSSQPEFRECNPWQPCWEAYFLKVEAAAKKSPDDVVMGVMYQDMVQRLGPEKANAMRAASVTRGRKETTNPAAQYLAGTASVRGEESLTFFARALKLDSTFGRAYTAVAQRVFQTRQNQDKKDVEKRFGTAEANLAQFVRYCPEHPDLALQFVEVGDTVFWKQYLSAGRDLIERYELPRSRYRYVDALTSLWGLEARLLPPAEAKARVAKDVRIIENLAAHEGRLFPLLDALAAGKHKLSDFKGEEAVRDEILQRFGCSASGGNSAMRIRSDRYWLAHGGRKSPLGMTVPEAREYYTALRGWMNACPNRGDTYMWSLVPVVYRLALDGQLTSAELAREERFIQSHWERMRPWSGAYAPQSPDYIFVMIRLRTGKPVTDGDILSLRRVLKDQTRWRTNSLMTGWIADELPKEQELEKVGEAVLDLQVSSVLARVLAARGRAAEARTIINALGPKLTLANQHLTDKEAYGVTTSLSHYWRARAILASGPDSYAFLRLADALQAAQGVDRDPSLPNEVAKLVSNLGIKEDALARWQGGPEGRAALVQAAKLAANDTEAVKENVWRTLKSPLQLPATALKGTDGRSMSLAEASKGKAVLVNFWATWCGPCQLELPLLTRVAKDAGPGSLLTVSVDSDEGEVEPYLAKRGFSLPAVLLGEKFFREVTQNPGLKEEVSWGVPQSWIVRDGKIVSIILGFDGKVNPDKWVKDTLAVIKAAN